MNVFTFTGNLGRDCRVGNVNNTAVCNFAVAVKSGFGQNEQTIWMDCALWGKKAEGRLPEFLVKGQQVAVSGELGTREHEGKTYLTCRVNDVSLVGGKQDTQQGSYQQPSNNQQAPNAYAQQVAQNAQGMQGQVSQQFANANQNPAMNGGGVVDSDIPFIKHFDGVM